jgi:hypothetical protein
MNIGPLRSSVLAGKTEQKYRREADLRIKARGRECQEPGENAPSGRIDETMTAGRRAT